MSIKVQRQESKFLTKAEIEGRSRFAPNPVQPDFRISVPNKNVRLHGLSHPLCGQMVSNVCKSQSGRNPNCTTYGCKQCRLGNTPSDALAKHVASAHTVRRQIDPVGIVFEAVTHSVIECNSAVLIRISQGMLSSERPNKGMLKVKYFSRAKRAWSRRGVRSYWL